jgi:hypothetical protein
LKAPRSLINLGDLISALSKFPNTQYGILGVYGDQESRDFAEQITAALGLAGWKATFSPTTGRSAMSFWLKNFSGGGVGVSISAGVHIDVTSEEDPAALSKVPLADRPLYIRAAFALRDALALSISPKQDDLATSPVGLESLKMPEVLLDIGNKPTTSNANTKR